jgi:RecB family exonuclease
MSTTLQANPANANAESLTGRDYISLTQVKTFQQCPLKWHFEYVEQLPRERVSSSLVFGGAIHSAIEHHFRQLLIGGPAPPVDELLNVYETAWTTESAAPIQFPKGETANSLLALAGRLLAAFRESEQAQPDGDIVGVEEPLRASVVSGCPDILARVDLLIVGRSALRTIDFKTARSRWNSDKLAENAPQLLLYSDMSTPVAEAYGDLPIRPEFIVLTKTKSPSIDVHPIEFDPLELDRTKQVIAHVWDAMRMGHIYPNPSPMNCPTCPFAGACRQWCG